MTCPDCASTATKKNGIKRGHQAYKCLRCGHQFSINPITAIVLEDKKEGVPILIREDKKEGVTEWREVLKSLMETQRLHEKASFSQEIGNVRIENPPAVLVFKPMADAHIGSIGTDYASFKDFTETLLSIPYLYTALLGDDTDDFTSFKSQLAVLQQIASPEKQDEFLESWLLEVIVKILFGTWGNHFEFEERATGKNAVKKILNRNITYFNGIGICNIKLGDQSYKIVATHKTRYSSSFNVTHGLKQLARREIPDADIYLAGHDHVPGYENAFERGRVQWFVKMGSLKRNDGHAKRYFSFFSAQEDPAITLDSRKHKVMLWPTLDDALAYAEKENASE